MIPFGALSDGRAVHAVEIGTGPLTARFLTYGAILQDLRLDSVPHSLTLGSDRLADYEGPLASFGPIIGPVVNRLTDARARLGDQIRSFEPNAEGGHFLHSGPEGTMCQVWEIADQGPDHVTFRVTLPDGACGLPGHRVIEAAFAVTGAALRLEVTARTDALTLMNIANHSYWTLQDSPKWAGHHLRIEADRVLPTDDTFVPTGEIRPVAGTDLDLRDGRVIAPGDPAFDNNFCLSDADQPLRDVLWLTGQTGLRMTLATTACGVQVYDQRVQARPGKVPYEGLAFEPQSWPDAPNHAGFPGIELPAGDTLRQTTEWRFDRV